jgi:voltage-gated potassium channel
MTEVEANTVTVFAPGRFRLLLLALLVFLVGTAAFPAGDRAQLAEVILLTTAIIVAVLELREHGEHRFVPIAVAASAILTTTVDYAVRLQHLPLIASAMVAVFSGIVIWLTYDTVMRAQRPVGDRIVGAICVYIMIGLGWGTMYETLDRVMPGSLRFPADTAWATPSPLRYRYFSFVTLATLGYGDVTPVSALTGILASMEALSGQLYIAITVARLVALSIVDRADSGGRPKSDA